MQRNLMACVAILAMGAQTLVAPTVFAQAETNRTLSGTFVSPSDSAKWVFGQNSGQYIQYKSINGNPGTIIIEFEYTIDDQGKTLNYKQTQIRLIDHPSARTQKLDKKSSEKIEILADAVIIAGTKFSRQ